MIEEAISATEFAAVARRLSAASHRLGLRPPGFRTPPRATGRLRTIQRFADDSVIVSVLIRHRQWSAVVDDMIVGVVVANRLRGDQARLAVASLTEDVVRKVPHAA